MLDYSPPTTCLHAEDVIPDYLPQALCLNERVILITGASRGIGRAAAIAFAEFGAQVILLGRDVPALSKVYDKIEDKNPGAASIYPFNLAAASPQDYLDMGDKIAENFGRLDGLLLNAASLGTLSPIEHYPEEQWYQIMQINLNSSFHLIKSLLPHLKKSKLASILFTLAPRPQQKNAYWGAYGISKAALESFMLILAEELEHTSVRVNAINPGVVKTSLRAHAFPAENADTLKSPQDILAPYLQLMSMDCKNFHGKTLNAQTAFSPLSQSAILA